MTNKTRGTIVRVTATVVCVGGPLAATMSQFPIWIAHSDKATVSGLFLMLAFICCIPFFRQIKEYFKSPAAWVVWTILFVLFILLRNIIDQMVFVAGVGVACNLVGTGLYKLGDWLKEKPDRQRTQEVSDNGNGTT